LPAASDCAKETMSMFVEAIEAILQDQFTTAAVRAIEAGGPADTQWAALADAGFLELLTPEVDGGAGMALAELFPVLTCLGRYAVPVPLAQSMAARALLAGTGVALPAGMITLAPSCRRHDDGSIECAYTPFGTIAHHVIAQDEHGLLLLACQRAD